MERAILALRELEQRENQRYPALAYARLHHINTRGIRMDFRDRPYLLSIYKVFARPDLLPAEGLNVVIKKCVQMGISEALLCAALSYAGEYGRAIMYVLPKFELKFTFSSNRIDKPINRVPYYQSKLNEQHRGSKTKGLKDFGRGVIKMVGSNVETEFVEYPADVVIVDEADLCDQTNIPIARDRLKGPGSMRLHILNGNPTIESGGLHDAFEASNRMEWYVTCGQCGVPQELKFFGNVMAPPSGSGAANAALSTNWGLWSLRDKEWSDKLDRDVSVYCRYCGRQMDRRGPGQWWEENPGSRTMGFHLTKLMDPTYPVRDLYETYLKGKRNDSVMQLFFNYDLGLAYSGHTAQLTRSMLKACQGHFQQLPAAPASMQCVMGIDVGTVLHYWIETVKEHHKKGEKPRKPRCVRADYCTTFEELSRLMRVYNVSCAVIDARPETRTCKEWAKEYSRGKVWRCDYEYHGLKEPKKDWGERLLKVDRTISMDESHGEFDPDDPAIELPQDFVNIHRGEVAEQMCNLTRIKETRANGSEAYVWDNKGKADHWRHAKNYASIAQAVRTPPTTGRQL